MEGDVRIAVAGQAAIMGNKNTTQPQGLALGKPMHVIPHPHARDPCGREHGFGTGKILFVGQFPKPFIALHQHDVMTMGAQYLGIVGRFARSVPGAMRVKYGRKAKGLRRLDPI